jgi:hypothetical protein
MQQKAPCYSPTNGLDWRLFHCNRWRDQKCSMNDHLQSLLPLTKPIHTQYAHDQQILFILGVRHTTPARPLFCKLHKRC